MWCVSVTIPPNGTANLGSVQSALHSSITRDRRRLLRMKARFAVWLEDQLETTGRVPGDESSMRALTDEALKYLMTVS